MIRANLNRQGFTLIELMIVVVIIGILAALAAPRFSQAVLRSKQSEARLILKQIYVNQRTFRQQQHESTYFIPTGAASAATPQAFASIWIEIMDNALYTYSMVADAGSFTATATADLDGDGNNDTWTMDEAGTLHQVYDDVSNTNYGPAP